MWRMVRLFRLDFRCFLVSGGARFSKAPATFRARKAIFSSSVSKDEEVYTPETSCIKRTSFHIRNL